MTMSKEVVVLTWFISLELIKCKLYYVVLGNNMLALRALDESVASINLFLVTNWAWHIQIPITGSTHQALTVLYRGSILGLVSSRKTTGRTFGNFLASPHQGLQLRRKRFELHLQKFTMFVDESVKLANLLIIPAKMLLPL